MAKAREQITTLLGRPDEVPERSICVVDVARP